MHLDELDRNLTVTIAYRDEHLIELQTNVVVGDWSASATAYTDRAALGEFARQLAHFSTNLANRVEFEAGDQSGTGYLFMAFYPVDSVGHLACNLRLASKTETIHRPEEVWRMSIEIQTEPGALDAFAAELGRLAANGQGVATLRLN